jgi:glycosyltransferase involved in cell wall biosynthesis
MNRPQKIKILHLVNKLCAGGAERQLLNIAKYSDKNKFAHQIVTLMDESDLDPMFRDAGVSIWNLGLNGFTPGYRMLVAMIRLRSYIYREGIDLLHAWLYHPNFYASLLKPLLPGLRLIVSKQGQNFWYTKKHFFLNSYVYRVSDGIFVNSENLKKSILSYLPMVEGKTFVIPNVVDVPPSRSPIHPDLLDARKAGRFIVGVVGRFCMEKEPLKVLEALEVLREKISNILVVFVGQGDLLEKCRTYACVKGLEDNVLFAGYQQDVYPWYRSFDIYLLASSFESLPNTLLEAQAMSIPTVATTVGDIHKVIAHEENGLLIRPGDAESIVDAVARLHADPALATALGEEGKRRSMVFSISRITDYDDMYLTVTRK